MAWERDCEFIVLSLEFSDLCFLLESSSLDLFLPTPLLILQDRKTKQNKNSGFCFFVLVFCVDLSFLRRSQFHFCFGLGGLGDFFVFVLL